MVSWSKFVSLFSAYLSISEKSEVKIDFDDLRAKLDLDLANGRITPTELSDFLSLVELMVMPCASIGLRKRSSGSGDLSQSPMKAIKAPSSMDGVIPRNGVRDLIESATSSPGDR